MDNKLNEIRKALEAATPGQWNDVESADQIYHAIIAKEETLMTVVCGRAEANDAYLIANIKEWLSYLLSELDEADKVIEMWKQTAKSYFDYWEAANNKLKDYEGCKGIEEYYTVLQQCRELKQDLADETRKFAALEYANIDNLKELENHRLDIEELIKERDMYADAMHSAIKEIADAEADNFILHGEIERLQQENERLKDELNGDESAPEWWKDSRNKIKSLQQQLKQAIEALEKIPVLIVKGELETAGMTAIDALSLIRKETGKE